MSLFDEKNLAKIQQTELFRKKRTLLIVDDELYNLSTLKDSLADQYNVITAIDGEDALNLLKSHDDPSQIHMIISDQRMPKMTGVEFLTESIKIAPQTIRIILTAYTDVEAIMDSINYAKIYKFILKPFDTNDIQLTIQRGLEAFDLAKQNQELMDTIKYLNENLFTHLRDKLQKVSVATEFISKDDEGILTDNQKEMLYELNKGGDELVDILNKASELSFVYTGNKVPRMEQLDIIELVLSEIKQFSTGIPKDEISLILEHLLDHSVEISPPVYLEIDRELFIKTLFEILDNAHTYSEKPSQIKVSAYIENDQFYLSISDQGIGYENEGGNRLLQPFIRGEKSYLYKAFGLGVGLAKVKSFLLLQNGNFAIHQQEKGTLFLVNLPLMERKVDKFALDIDQYRILISQNGKEDLKLFSKILEFEGYDVSPILQTENIVSKIKSWTPNAILIEAFDSKKATISLILQICETNSDNQTPVIVLMKNISSRDKDEYLAAGAAGCISKPMDYQQLKPLLK
jgi:response regulator RpfG family c-di-GMP phosphodiesterase